MEVDKFYEAAFASTHNEAKRLGMKAMELFNARQSDYFIGEKAILKDFDDVFLSMEGLGQFAAVSWLINPKGGNMEFNNAVNGFRRKRNQWSQEEGLAMYLLLDKLAEPDWNNDIFGVKPRSINRLLEDALNN